MIDWKLLRHTYESTPGMTLKQLSKRYHVKYGTVCAHKSRNNWNRNIATAKTMADQLNNSNLRPKWKLFCAYEVKTCDPYYSYKKAYKCKWSTAHTNAYRLLNNNKVQAELSKLHKQQTVNLHINRSDVLRKMLRVYFNGKLDRDIYFSDRDDKGRKHARKYPHLKENRDSNLEELSFGHGQTHLKLPNMERLGEFLYQVLPAPQRPAKSDTLVKAFESGIYDHEIQLERENSKLKRELVQNKRDNHEN